MYDSLQQTNVPQQFLEYFSQEGGENLLYELRFLPVNARAPPAIYMAENGFDQRVREPAIRDGGMHIPSICAAHLHLKV